MSRKVQMVLSDIAIGKISEIMLLNKKHKTKVGVIQTAISLYLEILKGGNCYLENNGYKTKLVIR